MSCKALCLSCNCSFTLHRIENIHIDKHCVQNSLCLSNRFFKCVRLEVRWRGGVVSVREDRAYMWVM